jgi:hypothetical protein
MTNLDYINEKINKIFKNTNIFHYVNTRFNIPLNDYKNINILSDEYLNNRINIFEKYCLNSFKNQSDQQFIWFIQVHEDTDIKYTNILENLFDNIVVIPHTIELFSFINNLLDNFNFGYSINTRCDSDDALHEHYIKNIKKHTKNTKTIKIINFNYGLQYIASKGFTCINHMSNHFCSLITKRPSNYVLLKGNHTNYKLIHGDKFINIDNKEPMFCEVVHETNLLNKKNGSFINVDYDIKDKFGYSFLV